MKKLLLSLVSMYLLNVSVAKAENGLHHCVAYIAVNQSVSSSEISKRLQTSFLIKPQNIYPMSVRIVNESKYETGSYNGFIPMKGITFFLDSLSGSEFNSLSLKIAIKNKINDIAKDYPNGNGGLGACTFAPSI